MSFYVIGLRLRWSSRARCRSPDRKELYGSDFVCRALLSLWAIGPIPHYWQSGSQVRNGDKKIPAWNGRYAESEENEHHTFILT
ncbi:hypothetical protein M3650_11795 [Paenibacillus sp. MER TA 81-3]|uniref:hypothetical protein n=1 Tax=Paenibacillus sp. MER TA 81-3 TaxID=2939573 RepID=UPI00203B490B|nr:hypothetical protein [Paenibacillus sp. MER TA 81-3]MCM3339300.1 hypothetical protein [Paenibacillus sp. MER TA 81-3]